MGVVLGVNAVFHVPVDLFGMQSEPIGGRDVAQHELHDEMAARVPAPLRFLGDWDRLLEEIT